MNHFDPLTYSIYADGELSPAEAAAVREHLAACPECARLAAGLERENRLLRRALEEEPLPASLEARIVGAVRARASGLGQAMLYAAGILLGLFAGIYYLAALLQSVSLFEPLAWFDPGTSATWLDWLFRTFFFVYEEGWSMFLNTAEKLSAVAVGLLALRAILPRLRRSSSNLFGTVLAAFLLLMLVAPPASAVEFRHVHKGVIKVAKGEVISGTLVAAGETVLVEGTVNGDLVAAGERVEIRGEVKGDVIAAGAVVIVTGAVAQNAIVAGDRLTVEGAVGRNVYAAGAHLDVTDGAAVGQTLFAAAGRSTVDGTVGDSLVAASGELRVAGNIGRDIRFRGGRLVIASGANVGGNVQAKTRQPLQLESGAHIAGKTSAELIRPRPRYLTPRYYLRELIWLLGFFVVGVLLAKLFPRFYSGAAEGVRSVWRSLGLGLAILAGAPVAVIVVAITLIGLPMALMALAGYLAALYLAKIFVAAWLGHYLLKPSPEMGYGSLGALFLGLAILTVAGYVPYLGALIRFVVLLAGLGALAWQLAAHMRTNPA